MICKPRRQLHHVCSTALLQLLAHRDKIAMRWAVLRYITRSGSRPCKACPMVSRTDDGACVRQATASFPPSPIAGRRDLVPVQGRPLPAAPRPRSAPSEAQAPETPRCSRWRRPRPCRREPGVGRASTVLLDSVDQSAGCHSAGTLMRRNAGVCSLTKLTTYTCLRRARVQSSSGC